MEPDPMMPHPYPLSPAVRLQPEWLPRLSVSVVAGMEPVLVVRATPLREHGLTESERMQAYGGGS